MGRRVVATFVAIVAALSVGRCSSVIVPDAPEDIVQHLCACRDIELLTGDTATCTSKLTSRLNAASPTERAQWLADYAGNSKCHTCPATACWAAPLCVISGCLSALDCCPVDGGVAHCGHDGVCTP